ncbi:MAG: hypothetical protein ACEQSX_19945 [Baekduiaceae bacterium]
MRALAAVLLVAALAVAGCGGDEDGPSAQTTPQMTAPQAPTTGTPPAPGDGRFAGLAACLREQGIEPKSLRAGPPDEAAMAALDACRDEIPEGAIPDPPSGQGGVPD